MLIACPKRYGLLLFCKVLEHVSEIMKHLEVNNIICTIAINLVLEIIIHVNHLLVTINDFAFAALNNKLQVAT